MSDTDWLWYRQEYKDQMEEEPPAAADFTREQLSALLHLIKTSRNPYADFSLVGKYGARLVRRQAMTGLLFRADGLLYGVEIYGPDHLEAWLEAFEVYKSMMIAIRASSRPVMDAYRDHIKGLANEYGPLVWALLYQTDVRARSERLLYLRDAAQVRHRQRLADGDSSSYDPDRQWNTAFKDVLAHPTSHTWWHREFHLRALLVITKTNSLGQYLDGDAKTSDANAEPARGTKRTSAPPASHSTERPSKAAKTTKAKARTWLTVNKEEKELCKNFQTGKCEKSKGDDICPRNDARVHQCGICLSNAHGAEYPRPCTASVSKGSRKGGKKGQGKW